MTEKTYGVEGLMDWVCQLRAGSVTLVIHFTGGSMTAYGVTPAKYRTANKYYQWVIEHSAEYRSGRIVLLGTLELAVPETTEGSGADGTGAAPDMAGSDREGSAETGRNDAEGGGNGAAPEVIKVASMADAIDVMKQRYGYTTLQVRTKAALTAAAMTHNIKFDGIEP